MVTVVAVVAVVTVVGVRNGPRCKTDELPNPHTASGSSGGYRLRVLERRGQNSVQAPSLTQPLFPRSCLRCTASASAGLWEGGGAGEGPVRLEAPPSHRSGIHSPFH